MNSLSKTIILIGIILSVFINGSLAQTIPDNIKSEIDKNDSEAAKFVSEGNLSEAARCLNKSAYLLHNNQLSSLAADYYIKVLDINRQLNNKKGILLLLNHIGMLYSDMENYKDALPYLDEALILSRQIDDEEGVISTITNNAVALQGLKKYLRSNQILDEAVQRSQEINNLNLLRRCYGVMYENYQKLNNTKKAYQYFELYSSLDQEIKKRQLNQVKQEAEVVVNKANAEKQLTEQELKHTSDELKITSDSLQKVEELTLEQRLKLDLNEAEIREKDALVKLEGMKKRYWKYGFISVFFFTIVLTFLLIKLRFANREIKKQRDMLDRQNQNIKSSIRYAETIQQSILPEESLLNKYFKSYIIYRPKDIVSGDFYWISGSGEKQGLINRFFVALVDCTGHGVPGAFMSMIGNRLLNEIVNERKIEDPQKILTILNNEVRKALRQDQTDNNDGMDIAFCQFNILGKNSYKLIFAGAKRNIYVIQKGELIVLSGDRKSIGGYGSKKENLIFKNNELDLSTDDMVYLMSDGIIDQQGTNRKRFGSQSIEEFIHQNFTKSLDEQKEILSEKLDVFMNNEEQRDDITFFALKML